MRITLIRPSMTTGRAHDALEPLALAILSALTPPEIERNLYDDRIESVPLDEATDLVAMSVDTYSARRAYQMARQYHDRGIRVIMGGPHPTLCPQEALGFADAIVQGDAEDTWVKVVEDLVSGTLKRIYTSHLPQINGRVPDRGVYCNKRYGPLRVVQFGRGCRYTCDFCSVHAMYGNRIRHRAVEKVADEIAANGGKLWLFADDNLFADMTAGMELCRALKPLRIRWACQTSLDITAHRNVVGLMAESGCRVVISGFESLNTANLQQMRKGNVQSPNHYEEQVRLLREHGVMVYGTFVFGYDEDTVDTVKACLDFAVRSKLFMANFNPLMPFPGTPLYDRLRGEGRLVHDHWWLSPVYRFGQGLFHPRRMTAGQLEAACYEAKTEFNRAVNMLRRGLDWGANMANLGIFLTGNIINRREIHRKQGSTLGTDIPIEPIHPATSL